MRQFFCVLATVGLFFGSVLVLAALVVAWLNPLVPHRLRRVVPALLPMPAPSVGRRDPIGLWSYDCRQRKAIRIQLGKGESLEQAVCLPWSDRESEQLLAGRWTRRQAGWDGLRQVESGLGVFRYPSGEPFERIALGSILESPPCWCPTQPTLLMFTTADGVLHRCSLDEVEAGSTAVEAKRVRRIEWESSMLSESPISLFDPSWPDDPRFRNILLVRGLVQGRSGSRIWWLRLDPTNSRVVEARPLTQEGRDQYVRYPNLLVGVDGSCLLAWLVRESLGAPWSLALSRLDFEKGSGAPFLRDAAPALLRIPGVVVALRLIQDGQCLACLIAEDDGAFHLETVNPSALLPVSAAGAMALKGPIGKSSGPRTILP